jgi:hypothetical protein
LEGQEAYLKKTAHTEAPLRSKVQTAMRNRTIPLRALIFFAGWFAAAEEHSGTDRNAPAYMKFPVSLCRAALESAITIEDKITASSSLVDAYSFRDHACVLSQEELGIKLAALEFTLAAQRLDWQLHPPQRRTSIVSCAASISR